MYVWTTTSKCFGFIGRVVLHTQAHTISWLVSLLFCQLIWNIVNHVGKQERIYFDTVGLPKINMHRISCYGVCCSVDVEHSTQFQLFICTTTIIILLYLHMTYKKKIVYLKIKINQFELEKNTMYIFSIYKSFNQIILFNNIL